MKLIPVLSLLAATIAPANAAFILRQPLTSPGAAAPAPALTYLLEAFDQANAPLAGGYAFGNVPLPTSVDGTIRVTNQGTGPVVLASATLTGDPEIAAGTGSSRCSAGMTLAPATSCFAYPVFTPGGDAAYSATFSVAGDHGAAATVNLTGAGTTTVALNAFDTNGNPLTGAVGYGAVDVGQAGPFTRAGRIYNTGTGVAVLAAPTLTGDAAFSLLATGDTANCGSTASLAANQYCNVYALFAPTAVGAATATYTLATTGGQSATVGLTGTGVAIAPTLTGGLGGVPTGKTTADSGSTYILTYPSSNSSGAWSLSSGTTAVATVSGNTLTLGSVAGTSTITATQAASGGYAQATSSVALTVGAVIKQAFSYTGGDQVAEVPSGYTGATIKAWGASGGKHNGGGGGCTGGGGFALRTVTGLTAGTNLHVVVGQGGQLSPSPAYGGGGAGGAGGYSGGGYSGVFTTATPSQGSALVIAGGGGAIYVGGSGNAGGGGGVSGGSGGSGRSSGGTQTSGAGVMQGGTSATDNASGGGGGYWGGYSSQSYGAGGGSGYAPGPGVTLTAGGSTAAGGATDTDYGASAGAPSCSGASFSGNPGRVVILWQP